MRDWSLWDDEVAIAVMDLCQTALGRHPNTFYSGVVFVKGSDGESRRRASTIAGEVAIALKDELHHLVSTEQYRIPGFTIQKLNGIDPDADKTKPVFNAELKVTAVRADGKLATRQDTVDKHNAAIANINDKELEKKFAELTQSHSKACHQQRNIQESAAPP